jgi:anti-sigma B factor antagonist
MQARQHVDADGLHVIELTGEVDLHRASELRFMLGEHAAAKRPALVVDVSGVEYMDSAGIATLIEYVQRSTAFGGRFALAGARQRLRAIFDLVRLGEIFPIRPTVAEAKSALSV